jgi:hypothetical protein
MSIESDSLTGYGRFVSLEEQPENLLVRIFTITWAETLVYLALLSSARKNAALRAAGTKGEDAT